MGGWVGKMGGWVGWESKACVTYRRGAFLWVAAKEGGRGRGREGDRKERRSFFQEGFEAG